MRHRRAGRLRDRRHRARRRRWRTSPRTRASSPSSTPPGKIAASASTTTRSRRAPYCDPEVASIGLTEDEGEEARLRRRGRSRSRSRRSARRGSSDDTRGLREDRHATRSTTRSWACIIIGPHATEPDLRGDRRARTSKLTAAVAVPGDARAPDAVGGDGRGGARGARPGDPHLSRGEAPRDDDARRRRDAADGRVDRRRHDHPLDEEGRRHGRSRRAARSRSRPTRWTRRSSPAAGTLVEIKNKEGETVPVNQVVAVLETDAAASSRRRHRRVAARAAAAGPGPQPPTGPSALRLQRQPPAPPARGCPRRRSAATGEGGVRLAGRAQDRRGARHRSRSQRPGTGAGGRVTKKDILDFIAQGGCRAARVRGPAAPARRLRPATPAPARRHDLRAGRARRASSPMSRDAQEDRRAHDRVAPHLGARALGLRGRHDAHRGKLRGEVQARLRGAPRHQAHDDAVLRQGGVRRAAAPGRSSTPRSTGNDIVYKKDINIGIAVAPRLGADRARRQERRRAVDRRARPRRSTTSPSARARRSCSPTRSRAARSRSRTPAIFGGLFGTADHQPAAGRDPRHRRRSRSGRSSSTTRSRSAR